MKNKFYKYVILITLFFSGIIVSCHYASGIPVLLVVLVGIGAALKRSYGIMTMCYMMVPTMQIVNRTIFLNPGLVITICRFGGLAMMLVLIVNGVKSRFKTFPIGAMLGYLLVALVSSMGGWFPMISYLKIANFLIMLLALHGVTKQMQRSDRDLLLVRATAMRRSLRRTRASLSCGISTTMAFGRTSS